MQTTDLGGHSGCRILLCEDDGGAVFVRKISSGPAYNERLRAQAAKQRAFRGRGVSAPAVLGEGMTDGGLYRFDMEYVQGATLAELMKTLEIGRVRGVAEDIVRAMVPVQDGADAPAPGSAAEAQAAFRAKIASLEGKICGRAPAERALAVLKQCDWSRFGRTPCHGDLTLENIIVRDGRLYLIDFLDSFHDSFLLDFATLMQDVQLMWAYRHQPEVGVNTRLRLMVFRDVLADQAGAAGFSMEDVWQALLLKLLRIYPYAKDGRTLAFLDAGTASVINLMEKGGAPCAR